MLISLLASTDVLTMQPGLQKFTSLCREMIPAIDRLAAVSSFPEVTQLVLSVLWALVPVQIAILVTLNGFAPKLDLIKEKPFYTAFLCVVALIMLAICTFLFEITPSDLEGGLLSDWVLRSVSTSRIGLGIGASIYTAGVAIGIVCLFVVFRGYWDVYFGKKGSKP